MLMFLAGRKPHDVAGANFLNRAALALNPSQTRALLELRIDSLDRPLQGRFVDRVAAVARSSCCSTTRI